MEQNQIQPPDSENELYHLLPEIRVLPDGQGVRDEVTRIFLEDVPEYFWTVRASSNHHPVEHRGLHGLYIHSKRNFTAYTSMAASLEASGVLDRPEYVFGTVASLVHDAFKYGDPAGFTQNLTLPDRAETEPQNHHPYAEGLEGVPEYSEGDHDMVTAAYLRSDTCLPESVAECVESHQGNGWGRGPGPTAWMEWSHHMADVASSREHCDWFLMEPPEIILEQYPHLRDSTYGIEEVR
jgi:hypothetical protein